MTHGVSKLSSLGVSGNKRPQDIFTPQIILDAVAKVWPEGIGFDPCSHPDALVRAEVRAYPFECPRLGGKISSSDGLALPWYRDRVFMNPPYKDLKKWLAKATEELRNTREQIWLIPVRTHRKWWREATRLHLVHLLDPIAFVGYTSAFPQPLCCVYTGERSETFVRAFEHPGDSWWISS